MAARLPEQRLWSLVDRHYFPRLLMQRHEDRLSPDIPDVSYVDRSTGECGWIELKVLRGWGHCPLLRPGQINWMAARAALGAPVWLLAAAPDGSLLWIPGAALDHRMREPGWTRADWVARAVPDPFAAAHHPTPVYK